MGNANIVLICGGSFQGKSLISLKVASHFNFSGVLSTDAVRNVLRVLYPNRDYLSTSTYLLTEDLLMRQMDDVSSVIRKTLDVYRERGEHVVVEGMHFSNSFINWASTQDVLGICLQNLQSLDRRVILKQRTRSKLRIESGELTEMTAKTVDEHTVDGTAYMKHADRIGNIHSDRLARCAQSGFHIIEFLSLDDGVDKTIRTVESWITE